MDNPIAWPQYAMCEDLLIISQATYYASTIAVLPEPLVYYCENSSSITRKNTEESILLRFRQYDANLKALVSFYRRHNVLRQYAAGIQYSQIQLRNQLVALTGRLKYRLIWLTTYPSINLVMLFGSRHNPSSYREKMWFFIILFGLFPRFQAYYFKKKYRPGNIWRIQVPRQRVK